jgi:hypothetical protein
MYLVILTSEDFDLPIEGQMKLIVRFGDVYNNDNGIADSYHWRI